MSNNVIYTYDQKLAGWYMYNGVFPLDVNIHHTTGKRFFVFTKSKTNALYKQWMNNKEKKNEGEESVSSK